MCCFQQVIGTQNLPLLVLSRNFRRFQFPNWLLPSFPDWISVLIWSWRILFAFLRGGHHLHFPQGHQLLLADFSLIHAQTKQDRFKLITHTNRWRWAYYPAKTWIGQVASSPSSDKKNYRILRFSSERTDRRFCQTTQLELTDTS